MYSAVVTDAVSENPPYFRQKSEGLKVVIIYMHKIMYTVFGCLVVLPSVNNETTKNTGA